MKNKQLYKGNVIVKLNFMVNFIKLYDYIYHIILVQKGKVDQKIYDEISEYFTNNSIECLLESGHDDIEIYQNKEEMCVTIINDFNEWILKNKKYG